MHFLALGVLVQIACAVHCVRHGRNGLWLMVIIFLSVPGCLAYAFFEILPQYSGRREVRTVKAAAARVIDPEREIRRAREALELTDTAANQIALADALAAQNQWFEAIRHYERAAAKSPTLERSTQLKLALACLEAGRSAKALQLFESLPPTASQSESDRANLLLARALQEEGQTDEALKLFADVGRRIPGVEPQCREAALLLSLGRRSEALPVLVEVERRAKLIDRFERLNHSDMYEWAARNLAELRSGQVGA